MATSTTPGRTPVKLDAHGDLIAAIPHLLGFRPADSVVLIGHKPPNGTRVGMVLRADLPPCGELDRQVTYLADTMGGNDPVGVTITVIGRYPGEPTGGSPPLPHGELVTALNARLAGHGVTGLHATWLPELVTGARWSCYADPACGGSLPDVDTSVLAAASAGAGLVTFGSREAMQRLLAPPDPAAVLRRSALLTEACTRAAEAGGPEPALSHDAGEVRAALSRALRGDLRLTDEQVVRLAQALSEHRVRDSCMVSALPAGTALAVAAERLWLELVRLVPVPERAEVACLLGYFAYMRGDGTFAGIALENALEADPAHALAGLLLQALQHGIHPERLAGLSTIEAGADLGITLGLLAEQPKPPSGTGRGDAG